jgi:hypothetical protein
VPTPLIVTISHQLGREEAKRRLDNGLRHGRALFGGFVSSFQYGWTEYHLDFCLAAVGQSLNGRVDVEERLVRVELTLPLLLSLLAKPIADRIRRDTGRLLDKPSC